MPTPVPTGVFERLDNLVRRIRASPAYTDEIGALLGILPSQAGGGDSYGPPAELKPVIKAGESVQDYKFDVHVTRLGQEAFKVQISRNGNGAWQDAAFATNNPCTVTVTPPPRASPNASSSGHSYCPKITRSANPPTRPTSRSIRDAGVFFKSKRQDHGPALFCSKISLPDPERDDLIRKTRTSFGIPGP